MNNKVKELEAIKNKYQDSLSNIQNLETKVILK